MTTYLQDLWDLDELKSAASVTMGRIQRLMGDMAFRAAPMIVLNRD